MLNNCYIELNHYLSIIIITIIVIIIVVVVIIIIQSYGFIVILKDHDKTFLNHSSFFSFLFFTLVSSCEYTEHLNRNVRRMDESKETFACSQV